MNNAATSERCTVDPKAPSILDRLSKKMIFRLLEAMQFGQIVVKDGENRWTFGTDETLIALKTDMVVRHLEDFGLDYARTLRDWRKRFNEAFPSLREQGYDERFRRLWEYYLCYCEGGFQEQSISVVHIVADRPKNAVDGVGE
jgi:hypothetical protein